MRLAARGIDGGAPGEECRLLFGEIDDGHPMFTATTYNNDGFELWIAYTRGRWLVHFDAKEARQLAWFILWDWWAVSTWFGLKRKLWYWALRTILDDGRKRWKKHGHSMGT